MALKILVVEDDYLQSDWLCEKLRESFQEADVEVISTESGFRARHNQIANEEKKPDVVLIDVMLRWTDPSPNRPEPPDEVKRDGFYTAGRRCGKLMKDDPRTRLIPVILYTQLERNDLTSATGEHDFTHMRKDADVSPLIHEIKKIASNRL